MPLFLSCQSYQVSFPIPYDNLYLNLNSIIYILDREMAIYKVLIKVRVSKARFIIN